MDGGRSGIGAGPACVCVGVEAWRAGRGTWTGAWHGSKRGDKRSSASVRTVAPEPEYFRFLFNKSQ